MSIDPLSIFSGTVNETIEATGDAIDKTVTSDEERLKLRNELANINTTMQSKVIDLDMAVQKAVTSRWEADAASESWLARNVRPLVLVFVTIATFLLICVTLIVDLSEQQVNAIEAWSNVLLGMNVTVYGAYFGGRSYEKGKQVYSQIRENGFNRDLLSAFRKNIDDRKIR